MSILAPQRARLKLLFLHWAVKRHLIARLLLRQWVWRFSFVIIESLSPLPLPFEILFIAKWVELVSRIVLSWRTSGPFNFLPQIQLIDMVIRSLLCCLAHFIIITVHRYLLYWLHHLRYFIAYSLHHRLLGLIMVLIPLVDLFQMVLNLLGPHFFRISSWLFILLHIKCNTLRPKVLRGFRLAASCNIARLFFINGCYLSCYTFWSVINCVSDIFAFRLWSVIHRIKMIHLQNI